MTCTIASSDASVRLAFEEARNGVRLTHGSLRIWVFGTWNGEDLPAICLWIDEEPERKLVLYKVQQDPEEILAAMASDYAILPVQLGEVRRTFDRWLWAMRSITHAHYT